MKELTLEAVERVMDLAGVDYPEAKEALLSADGEVEEAIRTLLGGSVEAEDLKDADFVEEEKRKEETKKSLEEVLEKLKALVKAGNVNRIQIRRGEDILLNVPVNVGLVGGAIGLATAPWTMIAAAVAGFGFSCTIEVVKKDGEKEEV